MSHRWIMEDCDWKGFKTIRVFTARGAGPRAYGIAWINEELVENRQILAACLCGARTTAMNYRNKFSKSVLTDDAT